MVSKSRVSESDLLEKASLIIADWRTGNFTQRDLASKYRVSVGFVNKHTKSVPKDAATTVNKLVEAKQELSQLDEQTVNAVHEVVDERTKHLQFFTNAAIRNVSVAVEKVGAETTQAEHRMLAETILKGKETVLGKTPDTAIAIQNNISTNTKADLMTDDELAAIAARGRPVIAA